jgi:transcription elongation factor Elf1
LTPLGGIEKSSSGKEQQDQDEPQPQLKLANLIRCLKCGAPHPTIDTYDLLEEDELIFCHLCGVPSSYNFEEQAKIRTHDGLQEMVQKGIVNKKDAKLKAENKALFN